MCILCLQNDFWMCHAIPGSTFRNKTTSKLRPLTTVPRVVVFVRFYCIYIYIYIYIYYIYVYIYIMHVYVYIDDLQFVPINKG